MRGEVVEFKEHLGQLLGGTVGDVELRRIAMTVVGRCIRDLKLAIGEAAWSARELAAQDRRVESARSMAEARRLQERYSTALAEYGRLASKDSVAGSAGNAPPDGVPVDEEEAA